MSVVAIIQARYDSKRFYGKILKKIKDKTILEIIVKRLKKSKLINKIVIATSNEKIDSKIIKLCEKNNYSYYLGSKNDVLNRYYNTAIEFKAKTIVRITGDCPLIDPDIVDKIINYYLNNNYDYVSNVLPPTFPDGLDAEVFSLKTLKKINQDAKKKYYREHVTSYLVGNKNFKVANIENKIDLSHLRWTIDYPKDLELIRKIYSNFSISKKKVNLKNVLNFLEKNPKYYKINSHISRNDGFKKALNNNSLNLNKFSILFKKGMIENKEIFLREILYSDANTTYLSWLNDNKTNYFLISKNKKYTLASLKKEVSKYIHDDKYFFLAIILKRNFTHIGNLRIGPIYKNKKYTFLGIMIGNKNFKNKGFGLMSINLATKFIFKNSNIKINKIIARIDPKNIASKKAFTKAGFILDKRSKNNNKLDYYIKK
tara:strand:- start:203 stop:1486 length:1284 start_codon:yes stop_codon:yes gene_type:complete